MQVFKVFIHSIFLKLIFFFSLIASFMLVYLFEQSKYEEKRLELHTISSTYAHHIQYNVLQSLSATFPLAALVRTQNGDTAGFDNLAKQMLPFYPAIGSLQLAPKGIVGHIVPIEGNEKAIGHNLLSDPNRNKEAFLARDTGKLTLAGPFNLIQGGFGAAGRLPIYLNDDNAQPTFWGFAAVLIRFPQILESVNLDTLSEQGIAYELSRIHPDTGEIQRIANSQETLLENPIVHTIEVPNAIWSFKVTPIKAWKDNLSIIVESLLALLFTFLLTALAIFIHHLKNAKERLTKLVDKRTLMLNENLDRLELAMGIARQGWFDLDLQTGEVRLSEEYIKLLGYTPLEFHTSLQKWQDESIHPDDKASVLHALHIIQHSGKSCEVEYRRKTKDGSWIWIHTVGKVSQWDNSGKPLRCIGIHMDISERKEQQKQLEFMAHYDLLTKLPNRALFANHFNKELARSKRKGILLAVCFLDLDHFKIVNDTYGHDIGDQLLIEVTHRIKESIREEDTLSRQGGDEFTLLLGDIEHVSQCEQTLQRILDALALPYELDQHLLTISASIGVTLYPHDNADLDTLIRHADQAMYETKLNGRNGYKIFSPS